jgi:hypothetical protein
MLIPDRSTDLNAPLVDLSVDHATQLKVLTGVSMTVFFQYGQSDAASDPLVTKQTDSIVLYCTAKHDIAYRKFGVSKDL